MILFPAKNLAVCQWISDALHHEKCYLSVSPRSKTPGTAKGYGILGKFVKLGHLQLFKAKKKRKNPPGSGTG